jgi:hypothetical protein
MKSSTFIYGHWAPNLKKFFKKIPIYTWPMFTHVHSYVNYEWTKIQLRTIKIQLGVDLNWIKSELKVN